MIAFKVSRHLYVRVFSLCSLIAVLASGLIPAQASQAAAGANAFYVAPYGSDSNPGTLDQPWKTIRRALSPDLKPGDTIYLRAGSYSEGEINLNETFSGSASQYIAIRNYPGETPLLKSTKLRFRDMDYVQVEGLRFEAVPMTPLAFQSHTRQVTGIRAINNIFENTEQSADITFLRVSTTGGKGAIPEVYQRVTHVLIQGNQFLDDQSGIPADAAESLQIGGNVDYVNIVGNTVRRATGIGIAIAGRTWKNAENVINAADDPNEDQPDYFVIRDNVVDDVIGTAIYLDAPGNNFIVENNTVFDSDQGIKVAGEGITDTMSYRQGIVRFNHSYDNALFAVNYGSAKNEAREYVSDCSLATISSDIVFVHNTFYAGAWGNATARFYCGEELVFKNNILVNTTNDATNKLIQIQDIAETASWEFDGNLYWSGPVAKIFQWQGAINYPDFESYRATSGNDANGMHADPRFVTPGAHDSALQASSPAVDSASALTRTASGGQGTVVVVEDARYFSDGFGLQAGDRIRIGGSEGVRVLAVDYNAHKLTLDKSITWSKNVAVNYDYAGDGPDIGAFESGFVAPVETFADVPATHPYYAEIETLYAAGYTEGCGVAPLRYCPDLALNRAEMAVFMVRGMHGAGVTPVEPGSALFADVPLEHWAVDWTATLFEDGLTAGCSENPLWYCPDQGHTRAEASVFFVRLLKGTGYQPPAAGGQFSDVDSGAWYARWVEAAYAEGLLPACNTSPLRFCPDGTLERGLAAYALTRAKGLAP